MVEYVSMNKPERLAWLDLDRACRPIWVAQRHEDRYSKGIPDVSFLTGGVAGWIELKAEGADGRFHVREEQVAWMRKRVPHGALCLVMARGKNGWSGCRVTVENLDAVEVATRCVHLAALGHSGDGLTVFRACMVKSIPLKDTATKVKRRSSLASEIGVATNIAIPLSQT